MKRKNYCPICQKETEYIINIQETKYSKDDVTFSYKEKVPVCSKCGEELFVDSIKKENQKTFENTYIKFFNIIPTKDIKEILSKYNISKENLSLVLGFNQPYIERYLDGYIPAKENSELLRKILNSPELYLSYLNANKDKLDLSDYEKSKIQIEKLLKAKI